MATRRLKIVVDSDTDGAKAGLDGVTSRFDKMTKAAKVGVTAIAALGTGTIAAGAYLVSLGSDASEMEAKFHTVFNVSGKKVEENLSALGDELGRNKYELMEYAAVLGDTFKPVGFAEEKAADLSEQIVELGIDLASFNNMPMSEALERLQSTLIGNHENALAFGVIINENTLRAELAANGWDKLTGAELEQAKVQARVNLLMKGTTDAQGDVSRTADEWANQTRALSAELSETATTMGKELLPIMKPILADFTLWVRDVTPKAIDIFKIFASNLKETVGPAMLIIQDAVTRIAQAFGVQTDEVTASDVVLGALKITLDGIITVVKATAITMHLLATGVEWVRDAIDFVIPMWGNFKDAVLDAVDAIPTWLIPHSPTPFEVGIRGIANAANDASKAFPNAFSGVASNQLSPATVGAASGNQIVVQLQYSPTISTGSQFEAESVLAPFIADGVRRYLAGTR